MNEIITKTEYNKKAHKKLYYYRGLKEYKNEKGYLMDTCLICQDEYVNLLKYFKIKVTEQTNQIEAEKGYNRTRYKNVFLYLVDFFCCSCIIELDTKTIKKLYEVVLG